MLIYYYYKNQCLLRILIMFILIHEIGYLEPMKILHTIYSFPMVLILHMLFVECINTKIVLFDSSWWIRAFISAVENGTVDVPVGSYLLNSFKNTIGTLMTNASPNGLTYTLTYPSSSGADTGKWTYTQTNGAIQSSILFVTHIYSNH